MKSEHPPSDIRGVLIQVEGARLLLPNAVMSEVLSYAVPTPLADAPDWLLGRLRWRGWQLPLVSFARLAGLAEEQGGLASKVVVLKALGGQLETPYFALLSQGFPRLATVSRAALVADADTQAPLPPGVQVSVTLDEAPAWVPDLIALETMIDAAVHAAA